VGSREVKTAREERGEKSMETTASLLSFLLSLFLSPLAN
jgi:hypothetical protein